MRVDQKIHERLQELVKASPEIVVTRRSYSSRSFVTERHVQQETVSRKVDPEQAAQWGASCLNILRIAFGKNGDHYTKFDEHFGRFPSAAGVSEALGVMKAALEDYSRGYTFDLQTAISGEIFQDFVELAKQTLKEGNKDAAAVLACAALEDALKRYAKLNGLTVDDEEMSTVVAALKAKGLVSGAQKTLLDTMPKIRNYAMHANWDKITEPDVSSVIGFVEQFLITHF